MAAAHFHTLPNEILERIVDDIKLQVNLRNLVVSSRACYRTFLPFLYRHISIWDAPKSKNLRILAKTLLRNESPAGYVQSFRFRNLPLARRDVAPFKEEHVERSRLKFWKSSSDDKQPLRQLLEACGQTSKQIGPGFIDLCRSAMGLLGEDSPFELNQWIQSISEGEEDALVILLLMCMPNLRSLDIYIPRNTGYPVWTLPIPSLSESFSIPAILGNLGEATYCMDREKTSATPSNDGGVDLLLFHFANPSTRVLRLRNLGTLPPDPVCRYTPGRSIAAASSNISHLELRDFTVHSANIAELMAGSRNLRTFIYDHVSVFWKPERIEAVLTPLQKSLETLWLGFGPLKWPSAYYFQPMKSIRHFTKLSRIRLPMRVVFSTLTLEKPSKCLVSFLPPSLELLHLLHCNFKLSELIEALSELFEQKSSTCPLLKEVILDVPSPPTDADHAYAQMVAKAQKAGVYFTTRDTSPGHTYARKAWGWDGTDDWYDSWTDDITYRGRRAVYPEVTIPPFDADKGTISLDDVNLAD